MRGGLPLHDPRLDNDGQHRIPVLLSRLFQDATRGRTLQQGVRPPVVEMLVGGDPRADRGQQWRVDVVASTPDLNHHFSRQGCPSRHLWSRQRSGGWADA